MLTHDTTAFVEEISVPKPDRRTDKLRRAAASAALEAVHVSVELAFAEEALRRLEGRSDADNEDSFPSHLSRRTQRGSTTREADARHLLGKLSDKLAATREHAKKLDEQVRASEAARQRNTSYRLHSEHHHTTYSESQFARMSRSQQTRPVLVSTLGELSWWWYLDRFWWDDERLAAAQVRSVVLERDRQTVRHSEATEHARALAVGELYPAAEESREAVSHAVRTTVWTRDGGRCVDCGADEDLLFDVIVPVSRGGALNAPNVEVRCRSCLALAGRSSAWKDEAAEVVKGARR
jgi:hypothetical protein